MPVTITPPDNLKSIPALSKALASQSVVYVFGSGVSSSLTGRNYGWWQWILDGIQHLKDDALASELCDSINSDGSTENLIDVVGKVIEHTKRDGTYDEWMKSGFESCGISNMEFADTLRLLNLPQDIFITTNYDALLESATGMDTFTQDDAGDIFQMIRSGASSSVVHIHGAYNSSKNIDNIVATSEQYDKLYNDEGAQFIQNLLGTRPIIFIGCGQTTDDKNVAHFIRFACEHLKLDISYFYLKRDSDAAPDLPDHFYVVNYGKEYSDLTGFLGRMARQRNQILLENLPFVGRTIRTESNSFSVYHYSNESLGFVGREKELFALQAFLNDSRKILWWAITGQGGSGKSRLAYELIKENDLKWFGFFANDAASLADAEAFRPFCNTIIVVDYVKGRENSVADWMHVLLNKFKAASFMLRIVLIERESDKGSGSWYNDLEEEWGRYDRSVFQNASFSTEFLTLSDLDDAAVEKLIGEVRQNNGLPADTWQDRQLRFGYHKKFEKLRYRPLFVQLYVEAWIANKCTEPDYNSLEGVVENALLREQERWQEFFDGDKVVTNSFIRLLIRAAAGGELTEGNIPELYVDDWKRLKDHFKGLTLPGKQRKESYRNFLADLTQNFEQEDFALRTYYPDIINEYMFIFYADDDINAVVAELREDAGAAFSVFLRRTQMDFRGNEILDNIVSDSTNDEDGNNDIWMLNSRLERLKKRIVKSGETPKSLKANIDAEYEFWHNLPYVEDAEKLRSTDCEERDVKKRNKEIAIATLKLAGLYGCAEQYGQLDLLHDMDRCMDELAAMKGEAVDLIKLQFLERMMTACHRVGATSYANKYSTIRMAVLSRVEEVSKDGELRWYDNLVKLQEKNNEMMDFLLDGDVYQAREVLNKVFKELDFSNEDSVEELAKMAARFGEFQMYFGEVKYENYITTILSRCRSAFPMNSRVISSVYEGKSVLLQHHVLILREHNATGNTEKLEVLKKEGLQNIQEVEAYGNRLEPDTWGMTAFAPIILMQHGDEETLIKLIERAESILSENLSNETAKAWMICERKLYEIKGAQIPKEIVDKGFAYYLRDPSSESTRDCFFRLLKESTERLKKGKYMLPSVKDSMIHDAMYNPISGFDAIEQLADIAADPEFREMYGKEFESDNEANLNSQILTEMHDILGPMAGDLNINNESTVASTYRRNGKKIGRNEPCPCGSGKKFKNCCGRSK